MTPLVRCTLAYIAGLSLSFYIATDLSADSLWIQRAVVCCIALLLADTVHRGRTTRTAHSGVSLTLFALLGLITATSARSAADRDCRSRMLHNSRVVFEGQPSSMPSVDGTFTLLLHAARSGGGLVCRGTVRAKIPPNYDRARITGSSINGTGTWITFVPDTRLPVRPERRGMLLLHAVTPSAAGTPTSHIMQMRARAETVLRASMRESGLAEAMVLAERDGLDKQVADAFAAAGMAHLLAIAGAHVGFIAALLIAGAGLLGLGVNRARLVGSAGAVAYVAMIGAPAAAARSALQIVLQLGGRLLQRPADPYNALAVAALMLLVLDPLSLLDAGFQLSFAGMLGLIAYRRPIFMRLPRAWPHWIREGFAASVAASAATLPIAAMQFGQIAPIGLVTSLFTIPLIGIAIPAILLVLAASLVSMSAARFFGAGADVLLYVIRRFAEIAAQVPYGHVAMAGTSLVLLLFVTAGALLAWVWWRDARHDPRRIHVAQVAAIAAITLPAFTWSHVLLGAQDAHAIEIHAIDVGQGDALAIRSPHGRWILIDTGPRDAKFDAGKMRVLPYLLRHGAQRIDVLMLSHPHADHIGGAVTLLSVMKPIAVIDPSIATGETQYAQTMRLAERRQLTWLKARDGRRLDLDGIHFQFFYPMSDSLDGTGDANDLSVAVRVSYGRFSAMFMGDAPVGTEERIVAEYGPRIASQVLKVGHHGSRTATGAAFLDMVNPSLALVSVGRDNKYGLPDEDVLARLLRHGVRVLRTDEHGAIVVRGDAAGAFTVATQR